MNKINDHQELSPEALAMIAERFRILGEPVRLSILYNLQAGEMSVGEITEAVQTSQPNVSKHLKMLQNFDIVSRRQEGNTVFYSIADASIFELCDVVCGSLQKRMKSKYDQMQTVFG